MSLGATRTRFRQLLTSLTRSGLHTLFPDEVENYAMSMELVNADGVTVDMLVFPVMPSEVTISGRTMETIKKTSGGVVSLHTQTFVPFAINISGTFGRKFRVLLGNESVLAAGLNLFQDVTKDAKAPFNLKIKTGYGVTKVLERIIQNSRRTDRLGRSYRLIVSLQAFNLNVVAVVNDGYNFNMNDQRNNMMWGYSIPMTAIAPAYENWRAAAGSLLKTASLGQVSKFSTDFLSDYKTILK